MVKTFDFLNLGVLSYIYCSLKYVQHWVGCKDIGMRKSEFVTKTQFT